MTLNLKTLNFPLSSSHEPEKRRESTVKVFSQRGKERETISQHLVGVNLHFFHVFFSSRNFIPFRLYLLWHLTKTFVKLDFN